MIGTAADRGGDRGRSALAGVAGGSGRGRRHGPGPRRVLGSALLAGLIALPLLGALGDCSDGDCPEGPVGSYQLTWDLDSLDDRPQCGGVETATVRIVSGGSGLQIRYGGFGPFDLTEQDGEFTWTENSTDEELNTVATYRIVRDGCNVSGDGTFTRTFLADGSTCSGVATITGRRTS